MTKTKPETTAPEDQAQAGAAPLSGPADLPPTDQADAAAAAAADAATDDAGDPSAEDTTAAALEAAKAAEADAAAKAAEAEAAAKAAEAKPAKALSAETLRAAIAQIEAGNTGLQRDNLLAELRAIKGAQIEDKAGTYRVKLHGLEVTNTAGWSMALDTWCSKARRAILSGEAV